MTIHQRMIENHHFREKQELAEPAVGDDRLRNIDPKMIELIENEIIDKGTPVGEIISKALRKVSSIFPLNLIRSKVNLMMITSSSLLLAVDTVIVEMNTS